MAGHYWRSPGLIKARLSYVSRGITAGNTPIF